MKDETAFEIKFRIGGKEYTESEARAIYYELKRCFEPVETVKPVPIPYPAPLYREPWEFPPVTYYDGTLPLESQLRSS